MFLGHDCEPEALEGLGAVGGFLWAYFCHRDAFTAWKRAGMGWTFPGEDPAAPVSPHSCWALPRPLSLLP